MSPGSRERMKTVYNSFRLFFSCLLESKGLSLMHLCIFLSVFWWSGDFSIKVLCKRWFAAMYLLQNHHELYNFLYCQLFTDLNFFGRDKSCRQKSAIQSVSSAAEVHGRGLYWSSSGLSNNYGNQTKSHGLGLGSQREAWATQWCLFHYYFPVLQRTPTVLSFAEN